MNEAITQALEWMCSIEENLEPMRFNVKWSEKSMKKKIDEIKVSESIWRREPIRRRYVRRDTRKIWHGGGRLSVGACGNCHGGSSLLVADWLSSQSDPRL